MQTGALNGPGLTYLQDMGQTNISSTCSERVLLSRVDKMQSHGKAHQPSVQDITSWL